MDLKEIVWEGMDWTHVVQDRDLWWGACEHDNKFSGCIKAGDFLSN